MKNIVLKQIEIRNFRGVRELELTFKEGKTTIRGANGVGKSTIKDAFLWLLFGKDSEGRKDYELTPIVDGKPLQKVDVSVGATLTDGTTTYQLERRFIEDWVKPRGETEEVHKGNHTDYLLDGLSVKARDYKEAVDSIIQEDLFRLLTSPTYFESLKWQEQRELLSRMTTINLGTFAGDKLLTTERVETERKKLQSERRKLQSQLEGIAPRIDQTERLKPEERMPEWELQAALQGVASDIKAIRSRSTASQRNTLETELTSLSTKLVSMNEARKEAYSREYRRLVDTLENSERELERKKSELSNTLNMREKAARTIEALRGDLERLRTLWSERRKETYDPTEAVCPTCGKPLEGELKERYDSNYQTEKKRQLNSLAQQGEEVAKRLEKAELERSDDITETFLKEEISNLEQTIATTKAQFEELQEPDYIDVESYDDIVKLKEALAKIGSDERDTKALEELQATYDDLAQRVKNAQDIKRYDKEIEALEQEGKRLSAEIAGYERREAELAELMNRYYTALEEEINKHFTRVHFKLSDTTFEGNVFETCIPLVDGKPLATENTAKRINAGLDIINAFTKHYGITAPIFVDNKESVTELIRTASQLICLEVDPTAKELTLE